MINVFIHVFIELHNAFFFEKNVPLSLLKLNFQFKIKRKKDKKPGGRGGLNYVNDYNVNTFYSYGDKNTELGAGKMGQSARLEAGKMGKQ